MNYMICATWDERLLVLLELEKRSCARCSSAIALTVKSAATVDRERMTTLCPDCMPTVVDATTPIAAMVDGQIFPDLASGLRAAGAIRDRN